MSKKGKLRVLREHALKRAKDNAQIDTYDKTIPLPPGAIGANEEELRHNNTYGPLPAFYLDQIVVCEDCGREEIWLATNQQWWYEERKANINTRAIFCRACRLEKKKIKQKAREVHLSGIAEKNT